MRRSWLSPVIAALSLLLGACGGDDGVSTPPTAEGTVESQTTGGAPDTTTAPTTSTVDTSVAVTEPEVTEVTEVAESTAPAGAELLTTAAVESCLRDTGLQVTPGAVLLSGVSGIGVNAADETDTAGFSVVVFVFESEAAAEAEKGFLSDMLGTNAEYVVSKNALVFNGNAAGEFRDQVLGCVEAES
ncbi:MAG: hypothetical protein IPM43_15170 [Actinomycetota bacterium]|nr:MAG: hypothetical protein IPM43_15170 [Actinomycetota bacterium]